MNYYLVMVFKLFNKAASKLTDESLFQEAYKDYCAYLARGKDKRGYVFKKDGKPICTHSTLERAMAERENVCSTIQYDASMCEGYAHWENVCEESAIGKNTRANTASLQMIMRNKFGWDTKDDSKELDQMKADLGALALALATDRAQHAKQSEDHTD